MPHPSPYNASDTSGSTASLNVMVVDDTITYRAILKETLSGIPQANVSETARNGQDALKKLAESPVDLVLLDVEMPVMNGMDTLVAIKQKFPTTEVVMVSGVDLNSANITFQALEAGALDFVPKPDGGNAHSNISQLREKLSPIIQHILSRKKPANLLTEGRQNVPFQPKAKPMVPHSPAAAKPSVGFLPKVLAIGVSTGGPNALKEVIPKLPANLGIPVVVVIHMPEKFTQYLADSLNRASLLEVKEATDGDRLLPNTVYIAPGGKHMKVEQSSSGLPCISITDGPPVNNCRPAVDVLFNSLPSIYSKGVLNIIMTGMGSDGMKGVQTLHQYPGNLTLTQTASSCTVYGMPKAVDDAGLSDESVSLNDIAPRIVQLCHSFGGRR